MSWRFYPLKDIPHQGILARDGKSEIAAFLTPIEAKWLATEASMANRKKAKSA
jgi:hypothetical protein